MPPELNGAVVTNDFLLFDVDQAKLHAAFLDWLSKTPGFVELCRRASEGTTNRVRLQEGRFLALDIPLPPLPEQRRIVRRIEAMAWRINEVRGLRQQMVRQAEALMTSLHLSLGGGRTRKLGDLVVLDEDAVPVAPTGEYPQVGMKSFGLGLFPKARIRGVETAYKTFNRLYEGALVLSQVKGWEGAIAVCDGASAGSFVSPEYRTFRCVPSEARPEYLRALVRTEWFWGRLGKATRGVGARRERTRPEQFVAIEIPMPNVAQQEEAEAILGGLGALKGLQCQSAGALDLLLSSILDRAFKGEL